jgi:glycosyltransferase involved in cell wall biosynthesis
MIETGMARCIWVISKYASSREYGFETRLFALAREFVKAGRQTVVISSDSNHLAAFPPLVSTYTSETIAGCTVRWIRTLKYMRTTSLRRILSWLDFEWKLLRMPRRDLPRPDVIIVSSLSLLTVLTGVWLRRRFRCRLVFEVRDIWPLTATEEGGFSRWHPFILVLAWVERFGYRHADLVVGTMPNLAEHVATVVGGGITCACVPFGYDPSAYEDAQPAPPDTGERLVPPGKLVVGYAGSIGVTNALDTIFACIRALRADARFSFLFLGDGDSRERYIAETRDLTNVVFVPKVERALVRSVLRQCDLLYFAVHDSAVWRYGLSLNKLIDYMMAAKPIVGSYSGYPSMLNEAGCGEFVPAADVAALTAALVRFAEMSPQRRAAMGRAGREWLIANRPWSVIAQRYLRLCDALVGALPAVREGRGA